MKKILLTIATAIFVSSVSAKAGGQSGDEFGSTVGKHDQPWNYNDFNGRDWKMKTKKALHLDANGVNECGGTNQSPIDLKTSWRKIPSKMDNFQKMYNNQVSSNLKQPQIQVDWNGHTSQTGITKTGQSLQMFESQHAKDFYGANERYSGVQFHFHHGSEHTVDGIRQDLEMHTVHLADGATQNGFFASAMGIMFSVNNPSRTFSDKEVAIVDKFFDDLSWDKTTKSNTLVTVDEVSYGEIMMMFDMNNRWTYKGSVTTPPCAQNVFWNVLTTVYPIKQKHLDQFKAILQIDDILKTGNWREIQPLTSDHNPTILYTPRGSPAFLVLFIIFFIISIVAGIKMVMLHKAIQVQTLTKVQSVDQSIDQQKTGKETELN